MLWKSPFEVKKAASHFWAPSLRGTHFERVGGPMANPTQWPAHLRSVSRDRSKLCSVMTSWQGLDQDQPKLVKVFVFLAAVEDDPELFEAWIQSQRKKAFGDVQKKEIRVMDMESDLFGPFGPSSELKTSLQCNLLGCQHVETDGNKPCRKFISL